MGIAFLVLFYLIVPAFINYLSFKFSIAQKVGTVLIAYLIGLIIGNIGIFPEASQAMMELVTNKDVKLTHELIDNLFARGEIFEDDVQYFRIYKTQDLLTTIAIAFALPLILFSMNIRSWLKIAGKTFLSMFLGVISVIIPIFIGYFIFKNQIDESWKVAGMMTGVYTGGTPNLAAIQKALDINTLTYILTHTYDLMIGAIFLVFVLSIGQKVLLRFLPAFKFTGAETSVPGSVPEQRKNKKFFKLLQKKYFVPNLAALGVAGIIILISAGFGELVNSESQMLVIILSITTLGMLASMIPKIHRIENTYDYGMYFILIFSVVVASMADLRYFSTSHIQIFYWVILVYFGSLIIHIGLAALFKIDADNVLIVSTALTCSPAFVPVVAGALNNKEIVASGLTVGIIGYAVGNYLGVFLANFLHYYF
jgi:uncharacterized membrane protein